MAHNFIRQIVKGYEDSSKQGVMHRDIKLLNIGVHFVDSLTTEQRFTKNSKGEYSVLKDYIKVLDSNDDLHKIILKLLDFGVARVLQD